MWSRTLLVSTSARLDVWLSEVQEVGVVQTASGKQLASTEDFV
jgi:hypothetical protein